MTEQQKKSEDAAHSATSPSASDKAQKSGLPSGDVRTGMSFWNTAVFVSAGAADFIKPVADFALFLLIVCVTGTVACVWLAFVRKPPSPLARTFLGTFGLGAAVFAFFVLGRFATPEGVGQERGLIAGFVPPVAAVQSTVLPLSPAQKELLDLQTLLSTGDPEARSAAARSALGDPKMDPSIRRAKLERILRNSDPNIQQAGIVQAIKDLQGADMTILVDDGVPESRLSELLLGAQVSFTQVNLETGALTGAFAISGGRRSLTGQVSNGRLIVNLPYLPPGWKGNVVLDLHVDGDFKLVGTAKSSGLPALPINLPLL